LDLEFDLCFGLCFFSEDDEDFSKEEDFSSEEEEGLGLSFGLCFFSEEEDLSSDEQYLET